MADLDSLIGCKISLISHQDLRYSGNLFSINQAESSIVLKDVQVFGTEDRVTDPAKVVPASVVVIPFVTFPGSEIKDLFVHESSEPALPTPPPAAATTEQKKSTADHKPARHQHNNNNNRQKHEPAHPPNPPTAAEEKEKHDKGDHHRGGNRGNAGDNNNRTAAGTGSHLLKMRERKGNNALGSTPEETTSDFNFEESLKSFKKDEVLKSVATGEAVPKVKKYQKDDFFDSISNDASGLEVKTRLTASEERQLNQDTFGAIALQSSYRRGYRGGRGGGRGRGGGNGRGGGGGSGGFGRGGGYGRGRGNNNYRQNNNQNRANATENTASK